MSDPSFVQDVDGYWYWEPGREGHWSAERLRMVAKNLDKINERWDEIVKREIGSQSDAAGNAPR